MANRKSRRTALPRLKPRNPYVAAALTRQAGAHGKQAKAIRQQDRQNLQRGLDALLSGELTEFDMG